MFTSSMGRASASPSWRRPSWDCICDRRKDLAMRMKNISALPWFIVLAAVPMVTSCAIKNDIQAAASGCDEFQAGGQAVAGLGIDTKVKAFAQASAELRDLGNGIKADVKVACVNIAKDLGETDRWSAHDPANPISNSANPAACA